MSEERDMGVCMHCSRTGGPVGAKCEEPVCQKQGYHYIPAGYAQVVMGGSGESGDYGDPQIGRKIDRYLIAGKIGQGGMGAVYLALQMPLEREVALKMIPNVTLDETSKGRFEREAKAISSLYHPNIVQLYEYGFNPTTGAPFMALEFVKGGRELMDEIMALRDASIPWASDRVQKVFGQVLSALQTAHNQGFVHRDIKPQNIMLVDVEGTRDFVKILDFGLARTLSHVPGMDRLTGTGTVVGTPQYIAPEQLVAGKDIDSRSDLYSVGAALFEVATGLTAYPGLDPRAVLSLKLDPDYDPVSRIPEGALHPPLRELLARAMTRDPDDRFSSANEMREALNASLSDAPPLGRASLIMGGSMLSDPSAATEVSDNSISRVDPVGTTVPSEPTQPPGTLEISSYERPSHTSMDSIEADIAETQRAPMKLIVAGALTGIVLLAAALAVIFGVLPALDDRSGGTSSGGGATDLADGSSGTAVDDRDGDPETEGPELSWVIDPITGEEIPDPEGTSGKAKRKKKVTKPVDAGSTTAADPSPVSPDPAVDPGGSTAADPKPVDPGGPPPAKDPPLTDPGNVGTDPGTSLPKPPIEQIKKKLASLTKKVEGCLPEPQGQVTVAIVVSPTTGRPVNIKVSGFYPGGTQTKQCIENVIKNLQVPSWSGEKVGVPHVYKFGDASAPLPETLTKKAANKKLKKASGWIVACAAGMTGKVKIQLTVEGKTGKVTQAVVMNPPYADSPEGDCMEKALEKMLKFPPFQEHKVQVTHSFKIP